MTAVSTSRSGRGARPVGLVAMPPGGRGMEAGMNLGRRASFLFPLSFVGCRRKTASPAAAAEAFLDAYYVERNHDHALAVSAGSAEARVRKEKELRAEAGGDYGVQPKVYYARKGERPTEEGQEFTYELTIDSSGVRFRKSVLLRVRRYGEEWKVSAFGERDVEEARP